MTRGAELLTRWLLPPCMGPACCTSCTHVWSAHPDRCTPHPAPSFLQVRREQDGAAGPDQGAGRGAGGAAARQLRLPRHRANQGVQGAESRPACSGWDGCRPTCPAAKQEIPHLLHHTHAAHPKPGLPAWLPHSLQFAAALVASPELEEANKSRTLVGRLGTPGDMAAAVAFLASEDAAYITGEAIVVAGGMQSRL